MMNFKCELMEKYCPKIVWDGAVEVTAKTEDMTEALVESRSCVLKIVVGRYSEGHFLCIPEEQVSMKVKEFSVPGIFSELVDLIDLEDALTVAYALDVLATVGEIS